MFEYDIAGTIVFPREGEGWLKTLPAWLARRLRRRTQAQIIRVKRRPAPRTAPTTMPAICPGDRPRLAPPPFPPDEVPVAPVAAVVELGKRGDMDVVVGKSTPWQRSFTLELLQQESVAFGELEAQKEHRPWRLLR